MPIITLSSLYAQLDRRRDVLFTKTSATAQLTGAYASLWVPGTLPAAGAAPTTAAVLSDATAGAMLLPLRNGTEERLVGFVNVILANAGAGLILEDRLSHSGAMSGTVITAQTSGVDVSVATSNMVARVGKANYSEVSWWLEWYTATGVTAVTPTANVTYHDATTGAIVLPILATTMGASRRVPIHPLNGKFIKSIQSIQLSATTGTAGNFGVTATRQICLVVGDVASKLVLGDWPVVAPQPIADNACLTLSTLCSTTTTGTITGSIGFAVN